MLRITELKTDHNHECSEELYHCYPEARRLPVAAKKEVEDLLTLGVRPDTIRLHLEKQDLKVINKDFYNIKEKETAGHQRQ